MSVEHFAEQNYQGYIGLLALYDYSERYGYIFDANKKSGLDATPLHFAVIFRELKNVELLLKYGAKVNTKDR